jgi:RND superfamily putative drug exporter
VIRALLVPALVSLMGRWNWWLPGWLAWFAAPPDSADPAKADVPVELDRSRQT